MPKFTRAFVIALSLLAATTHAAEVPPKEVRALTYGGWKLPSILSPARLERLLNRAAARMYGRAFRYLGVYEDFDHGHVIFEEKTVGKEQRLVPRAILYHTQESAYAAHWRGDVDKKFDYLDIHTRNWIQWLDDDATKDGKVIENAREYLDTARMASAPFYGSDKAPVEDQHYSIGSRFLDGKKLGFGVYGESQFEFKENRCDELGDNPFDFYRGPIRVALGEAEVCLKLSTLSPFWATSH